MNGPTSKSNVDCWKDSSPGHLINSLILMSKEFFRWVYVLGKGRGRNVYGINLLVYPLLISFPRSQTVAASCLRNWALCSLFPAWAGTLSEHWPRTVGSALPLPPRMHFTLGSLWPLWWQQLVLSEISKEEPIEQSIAGNLAWLNTWAVQSHVYLSPWHHLHSL